MLFVVSLVSGKKVSDVVRKCDFEIEREGKKREREFGNLYESARSLK